MNIAVVGGGSRCKRLIEVIAQHEFQEIDPRVVAVADLNDDSPGFIKAKDRGLFITHDYNDFSNHPHTSGQGQPGDALLNQYLSLARKQ
jgi:hypothetical protein